MKHTESYVDKDTGEIIDVEIDDDIVVTDKNNSYDRRSIR
jgi:hypothetical protein